MPLTPMTELVLILRRIASIRKEKRYTQARVAEVLGLDRSTYARKEGGTIPLTLKDLLLLIEFLDIQPELLFSPTHQKNKKA